MRRSGIDGEGVAWAIGAFVASLLIGLLVEPFRGTIGLENVVICYLLVVVAAAAIGGRVRRRSAAIAEAHADAIRVLHRVTETAAAGGAVGQVAAEGLRRLLGARRVSILRRSPAGFAVTLDIGETHPPLDLEALTHLDREGRIPPGHHRVLDGVMVLPLEGVALDLVAHQQPVGYLVIVPGRDVPADRTIRLAAAAMANELAVAATERWSPAP